MRILTLVLFTLAIFILPLEAVAATRTWDGGGADANWTTAANWVGDAAPAAGDDLVFPAAAAQFATNNNFLLLTSFRSITVEGGSYTIGGNPFRLTAGVAVTTGSLSINTAVTLTATQTISSGDSGTITLAVLSIGSQAITLDGSGVTAIGAISGTGTVTKSGPGAVILLAATAFSGPITLNNGILIVDANIPGSSVTVNSSLPTGGTDLSGLGGTGTVGAVNVVAGGISAGSISSPTGIFSIAGGLSLSENGAYAVKIGGTAAGTGHDQLNVTGSVNLSNSLLVPIPWNDFVPQIGDTFIIIRNDGADPVNGTFLNLPEGSVFAGPLNTAFRISYVAGDGNDIAITRVPSAPFDFDGDGRSDVGVYTGTIWRILQSGSGTVAATQFGLPDDILAPADYDGDNRADIAVFRPSSGVWYIMNSADSTVRIFQFGLAGDIPNPNDFDGDGRDDPTVFRPSDGVWYQLRSLGDTFFAQQFGMNGDKPQVGDFDGDGLGDLIVYRPLDGTWHFWQSSTNSYVAFPFGISTDKPVMADYDGDGRTDVAVFRPTDSPNDPDFYILTSGTYQYSGVWFGSPGDLPVVADYDGDGRADIAVFRPSSATWFLQRSTAGYTSVNFGSASDRLIPGAYVR